jgi:nucleotide-binding universal stress UspA family protein
VARGTEDTKNKNVLVALSGGPLDRELVQLGCMMAKAGKGQVYAVHVVEVPRALPLDAQVNNAEAEKILQDALEVADRLNYPVEAEVIQAREAGPGIVDEADDRKCNLIVMGLVPRNRLGQFSLGHTVPYVLGHASSRVWVVRDPPKAAKYAATVPGTPAK